MSTSAARSTLAETLSDITTGLVVDPSDTFGSLSAVVAASTELLPAVAAGILIADPRGGVTVLIASNETAQFIEMLQAQYEQGPCLDCVTSGQLVRSDDLTQEDRWPDLAQAARDAGYTAVDAIPLRLGRNTLGGLNLFYSNDTQASDDDLLIGKTLADLTVLALTQDIPTHREALFTRATLNALNDRVLVGHAIGMIAGTLNLTPDAARLRLQHHANATQIPLPRLAAAITDRRLAPGELATPSH